MSMSALHFSISETICCLASSSSGRDFPQHGIRETLSIKAEMRGAKMEGQRLGPAPLSVDRLGIVRERVSSMSLTQVAKRHRVSRATVIRLVREANQREIIVAA